MGVTAKQISEVSETLVEAKVGHVQIEARPRGPQRIQRVDCAVVTASKTAS